MQRDVLRADTRALAAVGAAGGNVERPDDVEEILFKIVCSGLVVGAERVIVKDALFAGARRADIAAGVAADTARKLTAPERKTLLRRHSLQLFDRFKARVAAVLALFAEQLVKICDPLRLADRAAFEQRVLLRSGFFAVQRRDEQLLAAFLHTGYALKAKGLQLFDVARSVALYADDVDILLRNAVLLAQLHKGIGIARLQEGRDPAALF